MDETENTGGKQDRPWLFKKGVSGNPNGRPKGSISLKTWAKKYLESLTDEEKMDFIEGLPKQEIWKMAEGNPHNTSDMKVELPPVPIMSLDGVQRNNSNQEDKGSHEEN